MSKTWKQLARSAAILLALTAIGAAPATDSAASTKPVKLCGWIRNPTPANWWLVDRAGQWLISRQGGYEAEGLDAVPDLSGPRWIVTNGSSYGYGCGCVTADIDRKAMTITRIYVMKQRAISACRADKKLPRL